MPLCYDGHVQTRSLLMDHRIVHQHSTCQSRKMLIGCCFPSPPPITFQVLFEVQPRFRHIWVTGLGWRFSSDPLPQKSACFSANQSCPLLVTGLSFQQNTQTKEMFFDVLQWEPIQFLNCPCRLILILSVGGVMLQVQGSDSVECIIYYL